MNTPETHRPDRPVTRSRPSSVVLSDGLPTPPELEESPRNLILLSQQELRNVFLSSLKNSMSSVCVPLTRREALDRIDVLFQPDRPSR